jgi:hypothetical protein
LVWLLNHLRLLVVSYLSIMLIGGIATFIATYLADSTESKFIGAIAALFVTLILVPGIVKKFFFQLNERGLIKFTEVERELNQSTASNKEGPGARGALRIAFRDSADQINASWPRAPVQFNDEGPLSKKAKLGQKERAMFDQILRAAVGITAICLILALGLTLFAPSPTPPTVARLLDTLIYISVAGAVAIFGLLGSRRTKEPPPPP